LEEDGAFVRSPGHEIRFDPRQQRTVDDLLQRFAASPFSPPTAKDCMAEVGEELYAALVDLGKLVVVSPEVVFRREDYERMLAEVRGMLEQRGVVTAAEVRNHFDTSRRYVLALLEHFDAIGVTVREGDVRRLKKR
jgi:selenocysteine-specific elongation factor